MKNLVYFFLATICWLGIFEVHLIQPFALLPVTTVLQVLTGADYVLWVFCFIMIVVLDRIVDLVTTRNSPPVALVREVLRKVKKRGSGAK